jgi:hypothetical protein
MRLNRQTYWRSALTSVFADRVVILHESRDCLTHSARARIVIEVSRKDARDFARLGKARLCKRCGGVK